MGLRSTGGDSGELALLMSHDFPHEIEWAMNFVVDRDVDDRHSLVGSFAQNIEIPILLTEEKLEIGAEM